MLLPPECWRSVVSFQTTDESARLGGASIEPLAALGGIAWLIQERLDWEKLIDCLVDQAHDRWLQCVEEASESEGYITD